MTGLELAIDAAIRRQVTRARCEYRAGSISWAQLCAIVRAARETLGEDV